MSIVKVAQVAGRTFVKHSNVILTTTAVIGVGTTAYLAGKESIIAKERLEELYAKMPEGYEPTFAQKVKTILPVYLPAFGTGALTIACIVANGKINAAKQALLIAAASSAEHTLKEYQDKVIASIGKEKEQDIRKAIAEKHIEEDKAVAKAENRDIIFEHTGLGEYPIYDAQYHRYFYSSIDAIEKAVNAVNNEVNKSWDHFCRLNAFYEELNLPGVAGGNALGFNPDNMLEIRRTDANYTGLPVNGTPCFIMEFVRMPGLYDRKTDRMLHICD